MQRRLVHRAPNIPLSLVHLLAASVTVILEIRRCAFLCAAVVRAEDVGFGGSGGPCAAARGPCVRGVL